MMHVRVSDQHYGLVFSLFDMELGCNNQLEQCLLTPVKPLEATTTDHEEAGAVIRQ
jgi:hypothetical protein